MAHLYLASHSPRRRELLQQIGVPFRSLSVAIDESPYPGEHAQAYVERLAREKAQAGLAMVDDPQACVLGADTSVVLDGQILGKPGDRETFFRMMTALSGRTHQVLTGIAVTSQSDCQSRVVEGLVRFRSLSEREIETYWRTGEPQDKAGGYAIQGLAAVFIDRIEGSYSAVVGLPLCETALLLSAFGVNHWQVDPLG